MEEALSSGGSQFFTSLRNQALDPISKRRRVDGVSELNVSPVIQRAHLGESTRRHGSGATPCSRALAGKTTKKPSEVRLIGKTATHGDLCQGRRRCQHQSLRPFDSPSSYVCVRRVIQASPKRAGKVKRT
jgi:hypothetical protein